MTGGPVTPFVDDADFRLYVGDVRDVLPQLEAGSVDCCVTSPPYWGLRDYGSQGQLGLESSPDEYVAGLVAVFREVRRVLKPTATVWLNLGDSYADANRNAGKRDKDASGVVRPTATQTCERCHGEFLGARGRRFCSAYCGGSDNSPRRDRADGLKAKDMVGIPWRVALALQADGWYLRSDIIWSKSNPMPESVTDRPTKSHEYVFLLSKGPRYWFDQESVREPHVRVWDAATNGGSMATTRHDAAHIGGSNRHKRSYPQPNPAGRNVRSVWEIATQPYPDAHFAVFPEELPRRCIQAGCPEGGTVLDPFMGSGTTALVARKHGRKSVGVELNPNYAAMAARRLQQLSLLACAQ